MQNYARVWLEIKLSAIAHNFRTIKEKVSPLEVMPVLKANAYGLGEPQMIAKTLAHAGATSVGLADLREALWIKKAGLKPHIVGTLLEEEIPAVIQHDIVAPIGDRRTAYRLSLEARKQGKTATCHLLIDTGMGRLGMTGGHIVSVIEEICSLPKLNIAGIYSHFPHAYGDREFTISQIETFTNLLSKLRSRGITFKNIHIGSSDAINNIPESYSHPFTGVRTGINLYGIFDIEGNRAYNLLPAMTLKSKLVAVRKLPAGSSIGYGKMYTLQKPCTVGTIAAGYADGIPFALTNNGQATVHGIKCPMIGRISMDYTTVLLDDVPQAEVGDEVVLLDNELRVAQWARKKGTHPYDVICSFGNRVQRRFVS